jgi:hypothetical protein
MTLSDQKPYGHIQYLLDLDIDQLYSVLASEMPGYQGEMFSPQDQTKLGERIFHDLKERIYHTICIEYRFCERINDEHLKDSIALVAVLSEWLISRYTGFPVVTLATILVKIGIAEFCRCSSEINNKQ